MTKQELETALKEGNYVAVDLKEFQKEFAKSLGKTFLKIVFWSGIAGFWGGVLIGRLAELYKVL